MGTFEQVWELVSPTLRDIIPSSNGVFTMRVTTKLDPNTNLPVGNSFKKFEPGPAIIKPSIVHEPTEQIVAVNSALTLLVDATGTLPLSYEWRRNGTLVGTDSSRFYVANAQLSDSGMYKCVIANAAGHVESHPTSAFVGIAPTISIQPSNQIINAGQSISLSLTASATPAPNYQWKKGVTNIGADSSVYTKTNAQAGDSGFYNCTVSNILGSIISSDSTVLVIAPSAPVIMLDPINQDATVGDTLSLTVAATGTTPLHYQWKQDGSNIGTDSTEYTKVNIQPIDAGIYNCTVTNILGSTISADSTVSVFVPEIPTITLDPVSQDRTVGDTLSLTVAATGTAILHYQWKQDGSNIGTDSTAYSKADIQLTDAGLYKCTVTNSYGSADSSSANITVAEGGIPMAILDYYYENFYE